MVTLAIHGGVYLDKDCLVMSCSNPLLKSKLHFKTLKMDLEESLNLFAHLPKVISVNESPLSIIYLIGLKKTDGKTSLVSF